MPINLVHVDLETIEQMVSIVFASKKSVIDKAILGGNVVDAKAERIEDAPLQITKREVIL